MFGTDNSVIFISARPWFGSTSIYQFHIGGATGRNFSPIIESAESKLTSVTRAIVGNNFVFTITSPDVFYWAIY